MARANADRIQRARSRDGTEIVGRVHGQGPPLVLVHGGISDGDMSWAAPLPFLGERFTCYLPNTRGRGLSADNPDHSPDRLVQDVAAFADSIGEPVGMAGLSSGAAQALGAAARTDAVLAVAAYEPAIFAAAGGDDRARMVDTLERMGAAAGEGRLADAARVFLGLVANEDELPSLSSDDYIEPRERYVPVLLQEFQQGARSQEPPPTDPAALAQIEAPVLLLQGSRTRPWFRDAVRYVAEHVRNVEVREVPGAGHFGPVFAAETVADEMTRFFQAELEAA